MNSNLNSLHAFFFKWFDVANELVFISLFFRFISLACYPEKKIQASTVNWTRKLDSNDAFVAEFFLFFFSGRPKKTLRVALDIQKSFRCIKLKFHDEVRWVNYSSFRLINKPIWTWTRCWNFNIPIGSIALRFFSHSLAPTLTPIRSDSTRPDSDMNLCFFILFYLLLFFNFLGREISREWIFDAHRSNWTSRKCPARIFASLVIGRKKNYKKKK